MCVLAKTGSCTETKVRTNVKERLKTMECIRVYHSRNHHRIQVK